MDKNFKAKNHSVPQSYLQSFSHDGHSVLEYALLVEHANVPEWRPVAIKKLTMREHLYTETQADSISDDLERWFDSDFEKPAQEPIRKATAGDVLNSEDWRRLIRFLALQDVRSFRQYNRSVNFWASQLPAMKDDVQSTLEAGYPDGRVPSEAVAEVRELFTHFGISNKFTKISSDDDPKVQFRLQMWLTRRAWLSDIKNALSGDPLTGLLQHRWTILVAPPGSTFLTSDTPVAKLVRDVAGNWRLGGGWTMSGTMIFMPISPQRLLYVTIGDKQIKPGTVIMPTYAEFFNQAMTDNALYSVLSLDPNNSVPAWRRREEDQEKWTKVQAKWDGWHTSHTEAERKGG